MSELRELYQDVILDHNKKPRNFGKLDSANHDADGRNPLCGDTVHVYVHIDGDVITDLSFEGQGCAISKASASLMTTAVKGKTLDEAQKVFDEFHDMVTSDPQEELDLDKLESLGRLAAFAGVREYPARVKCASLAWHTLNAALHESREPVSTE